ncbi:B3 domain-containing protein [Populus alba x Populus x berolinensis]|uniref:B3 domain-containing protein n=2 Tax=Populus TaxID=3689 RepID=A0A4U5PS42_POPAL|nr:B3 domain-containing protein [Populus alba x Populus x berolinensis]TKS00163.1 B3 domain-containing protein [Populus alba]
MVIFSGVTIYKLSHALYLESLCRESERGKQRNGRPGSWTPLKRTLKAIAQGTILLTMDLCQIILKMKARIWAPKSQMESGGMLAETINIADGIRAPTLTTFQENFAAWEKTLKAFQALLGSNSFRNFQLNGRGDENSN